MLFFFLFIILFSSLTKTEIVVSEISSPGENTPKKKCYVWCPVPFVCTKQDRFTFNFVAFLFYDYFLLFFIFFSFLVTNYTGLGPHKEVKIARLLIQVKNSGYLLLYIFGFGWQWFGKYTQC